LQAGGVSSLKVWGQPLPYPEADRFVVGANLPWIGYGTDVGASAWFPSGGLSTRPEALDLLDRTLAALAADGISVVRTFLLCDARSGVRFDRDGVPAALDEAVFPDVDALLAGARRHQIRLMPVLLDFHLCGRPRIVESVQLGGRANLILDTNARHAFVELVLRPIVERYGDEEAIAAWDVMNEPEWCLAGGPLGRRRRVPFDMLQAFLGEVVACVHGSARQPVTIGCATTTRLDLVRPIGLDFYQVHWYEKFGWPALEQSVSELGLGGAPVILGEFPGRTSAMTRVLDTASRAGYAGALVWSILAEDDQSAYPPDLANWVRTQAI
jgi:hypothetical protein